MKSTSNHKIDDCSLLFIEMNCIFIMATEFGEDGESWLKDLEYGPQLQKPLSQWLVFYNDLCWYGQGGARGMKRH